jgi:release factor glutamine methyltransferase
VFDIVVSNPPYIGTTEKSQVQSSVIDYEPHTALFSGTDGLDSYRQLLSDIPKLLSYDGYVIFEIGYLQAESVKKLAAEIAPKLRHVRTSKDLGDRDRCIVFKNTI